MAGLDQKSVDQDRQSLLDLAVKFLSNPKILDKPHDAKVTFLKKKGLTEEEIEWAVKQVGESVAMDTTVPHPPVRYPLSNDLQEKRGNYSWRQVALVSVIIGSAVGAIVYWIKSFLEGWKNEETRRVESMIQQNLTANQELLQEMKDSIIAIKGLLQNQQNQLSGFATRETTSVMAEQSFKAIQADITSLKGLLLNRHQFPSFQRSPSGNTSIPEWQRPSSSNGGNVTNVSQQEPVLMATNLQHAVPESSCDKNISYSHTVTGDDNDD